MRFMQTHDDFSFPFLNLVAVLKSFIAAEFAYIWKIDRD